MAGALRVPSQSGRHTEKRGIMDSEFRKIWIGGVLCPIIAWAWGISSLVSREVVIPVRWFSSLPVYEHLSVRDWPATCISIALISCGLSLHFGNLWCRYPKLQRFSSVVCFCSGWAAGILFTTGIIVWSVGSLAGIFR